MKTKEHFIITELGSHMLDASCFLFGEEAQIYCQVNRFQSDIRGEEVAIIIMEMADQMTLAINMVYAENPLEQDYFPQTLIFIEGDNNSIELALDYWLRVTSREGTCAQRVAPPRYAWADSDYDVVHSASCPVMPNC